MRRIMNEQLLISENNPIKARYYDYDRFFYPWHFHSQYELIFVRESYGCCFVGDHIEDYKAGDLFLFGSNLPHYMRSDDVYATPETPGRVQGTIIQFEENFMDYSFSHYPQFMQIHTMLERAGRGLKFSGLKGTPAGVLLEDFPKEEGFRQIACLLEMLQELAVSPAQKLLASANYSETFPVFGDKRINKVLSYIQSNYTQKLSLGGIAAMAHMNPAAFCRYFKEQSGKTLLEYIMDVRIGYACRLLVVSKMTVAQIALECGFDSLTHFNKMFKKLTKFTPTSYREHILK